jgi:hypothetical protein
MRMLCVILALCFTVQAKTKPTPIAPSRASLLRQNICADQMGLQRLQNQDEVQDAISRGVLIALPITPGLRVAPSLPLSRRYARPTTVQFLLTLSEAYRLRFGKYLTIDSAVRDADTQRRLRRINPSAAPVSGETASAHETGAAVDVSKNLSRSQLQWLRNMLSMYQAMNVVVVEEERRCLHIVTIGETEQ